MMVIDYNDVDRYRIYRYVESVNDHLKLYLISFQVWKGFISDPEDNVVPPQPSRANTRPSNFHAPTLEAQRFQEDGGKSPNSTRIHPQQANYNLRRTIRRSTWMQEQPWVSGVFWFSQGRVRDLRSAAEGSISHFDWFTKL
jgi:hypothetical protein